MCATESTPCIKTVICSFDNEYIEYYPFQNISDEKFDSLFDSLAANTHLETLSLTNVALTDRHAFKLAEALEINNTLKVVNVETNFISPSGIVRLVKSLLKTKTVEEFRASNQVRRALSYLLHQIIMIFWL